MQHSGRAPSIRRRRQTVERTTAVAPEILVEETRAAEEAWRELCDRISLVSAKNVTERRRDDASEVRELIQHMVSSMKKEERRIQLLPKLTNIIRTRASHAFVQRLFNSGFLSHVRGWFQLSLQSGSKDSKDERLFRYILLRNIDLIKQFVSRRDLSSSRLNKVMLKCTQQDTTYNRRLALQLFNTFCNALGEDIGGVALTSSEATPVVQQSTPSKRPKLRQRVLQG